jgi:hypothetical protein
MSKNLKAVQKTEERSKIILGRSAATGQFVLRPASKVGSVTLHDASVAVDKVRAGRKK